MEFKKDLQILREVNNKGFILKDMSQKNWPMFLGEGEIEALLATASKFWFNNVQAIFHIALTFTSKIQAKANAATCQHLLKAMDQSLSYQLIMYILH